MLDSVFEKKVASSTISAGSRDLGGGVVYMYNQGDVEITELVMVTCSTSVREICRVSDASGPDSLETMYLKRYHQWCL